MEDQSVNTEVAAEERLLAAMGEDEPQEEPPEEELEADSEQPEEQAEPEVEYLDLVVNGEQVKKTKTEVLELAQKGEDYTRKTQQLADERRALQAQAQAAQQQAQLQAAITDKLAEVKAIEGQLNQYKSVDWNALVDSDPVQAMKLDRQYRELQQFYQTKVGDIRQSADQLRQQQEQFRGETLQRESQKLLDAVPEWKDSTKAQAEKAALKSYLLNTGFTDQEIDSAVDHRSIVMARKAMLYDQLMTNKPAVEKKVSEAPKPVKSNAPQVNKTREQYKQSRETLKRTGRTDAAERALLALL